MRLFNLKDVALNRRFEDEVVFKDIVLIAKRRAIHPMVRQHARIRDVAQQIYQSHLDKLLAGAKAQVLNNLHRYPSQTVKASFVRATNDEPSPDDLNFDLTGFNSQFMAAMGHAAADAFTETSRGLGIVLGKDEYQTPNGIVRDFINTRKNKISGCPGEIYDQINRVLKMGIGDGDTFDEIAEAIQKEFTGISKGRALVIAQTESQSVYGTAQMDLLDQSGFTMKAWQTADDELVRDSHAECEDEGAIDNDDAFSNGLMYPGDPDGSAAEVINCRCFLVPGYPDEGL